MDSFASDRTADDLHGHGIRAQCTGLDSPDAGVSRRKEGCLPTAEALQREALVPTLRGIGHQLDEAIDGARARPAGSQSEASRDRRTNRRKVQFLAFDS